MKTTLTRLFTVMMLIMVSMTAVADVKVLYGKSGNDTFTGGKISATQEVQKDGQVAVTFTIKPDNGYTFTYTKTSLVIVSVYDPSSQSGTRADEIRVSETLWPKGTEGTISYPNYGEYTVTVDSNLGVWVQTLVFKESGAKVDPPVTRSDYSGHYYIAYFGDGSNEQAYNYSTNSADHYYWCPVECTDSWKGWFQFYPDDDTANDTKADTYQTTDSGMDFLTTYKCRGTANYDSEKALWTITKSGDCYYIIHSKTGKYLTMNGNMNGAKSSNRLRFHLQTDIAPNDKSLFIIDKRDNSYFLISPKNFPNQYINVSGDANKGNYNETYGGPKKTDGPTGLNVGGTLGWYTIGSNGVDNNNKWYLEKVQCATPYISSFDKTAHTVTIESETEGSTIYYTSTTGTDLADPTTSSYTGYGSSPLVIENVNADTKFKAIAVKNYWDNSEVASQELIVDQTISLSGAPFVYTGTEIEPTVSINDGAIPSTEYEVAYSNYINAGTATATITNIPGGNYYVIGGSVDYQIAKATLTVTAKDKTITYGQEAANDGVTYAGFVGTEDETVLGGTLGYAYNYSQFGNVGNTYTITPNGLTSDNYEISFDAGTLTVEQKEVGIVWTNTTLSYTGAAQAPTATATGLENGDLVEVTVTGAQTAIGTGYTATATGLTGEKATNYKLPTENLTTTFEITNAVLTITANDHTITYGEAPAHNNVTLSDPNAVLEGELTYTYNYEQYGDVGDYTITLVGDVTCATYENINFVAGKLTVSQKEVGITWWETRTFTYNGSEQAPTATMNTGDLVNNDEIGMTVTLTAQEGSSLTEGNAVNAGSYIATATLTGDKAGNYQLSIPTVSFIIEQKSMRSSDIKVDITKGSAGSYSVTVKDGETLLNKNDENDYTLVADATNPKYYIVTVTGKNNYKETATVKFVNVAFSKSDQKETGWAATFFIDSGEGKFSTPTGFTPHIVTGITSNAVNLTAISYIPESVPVLLLSDSEANGFVAQAAGNDAINTSGNLLRIDDADKTVAAAEIYLLYKGEFVLNIAGTLPAKRIYLPKTTNSGARLMMTNDQSTGIVNIQTDNQEVIDKWYSLDGRRLNGKPTKRGLYIRNGQKVVVM